MLAYPATLPNPSYSGYSLNPSDACLRTDMEAGASKVRRRTMAPVDMYQVAWLFTDQQMKIFRGWYGNQIAGGASWFAINLADGYGGLVSREARFAAIWQARLVPHMLWEVTANLEVRHDISRSLLMLFTVADSVDKPLAWAV